MNSTPDWHSLTEEEAAEKTARGLVNIFPGSQNKIWPILFRHIFTLFNLLNLLLALALLFVGSYRNMLFLGVVLSNIVIGVTQEFRAKRLHDELALLAQSQVDVMRDQIWKKAAPETLVESDVIRLGRGSQIPADALILEGSVSVDESLLTGESIPIAKKEGDALFGGTFVTGGSVIARLTAVGAQSYAGRLQVEAKKIHQPKSHLMRDLNTVIRVVSIIVLPLGAALLWRSLSRGGELGSAVQGSVASILGMIPEGLILLTSVSLTAGVIKLGKNNTLVNVLYGIEGLARTDTICIDKTGTLTSGEMQVEELIPLGESKESALRLLSGICGIFAEDSPTNRALKAFISEANIPQVLQSIPFTSDRQWSAALLAENFWVLLGAPERLLNEDMLHTAQNYAAQGLRTIVLCTASNQSGQPDLSNISPAALILLRDRLRVNVQQTVAYFENQGVSLKVISGDSAITVSQIAKAAGISGSGSYVDLSLLPHPLDYSSLCKKYTVFGRTTPDEKRMLLQAFKHEGRFTAMVGDGVNDIPALKEADCAIVMAGGSDAAARIAQIHLLDGDFSGLPQIVDEGRRVVNNITRAASLFLMKNIFSLLCTVILLFLPYQYPFAPIQLTLISSLTIGFPSFVLALEPNHERIKGNFLLNIIRRALPGGICGFLMILFALVFSRAKGYSLVETRTLCTLLCAASGIAALILTCQPLNFLRASLIAAVSAVFVLAVFLFPNLFLMTRPDKIQWIIAGVTVLISIMLQIFGAKLIQSFLTVLANFRKKSYTEKG